jgi:tRNA(His) 5'-end guanylyltransferase
MSHTEYDVRMKENYEKRSRTSLTRRVPVIIRVDGKAFHTFCRRFERPYDEFLNLCLNQVMGELCGNIQGAKFAERHSDEISILLTDFDTIRTDAYFDYEVQKICSVVASMATSEFCRALRMAEETVLTLEEPWPNFDARCFNIPMEEVTNYFWWRMLDAKRNSISMVAQANFSHKKLQGKSCDEMQEMLWQEKQINWAKLPQGQKVGFICLREMQEREIPAGPMKGQKVKRNVWAVKESPSQRSALNDLISGIEFVKESSQDEDSVQ